MMSGTATFAAEVFHDEQHVDAISQEQLPPSHWGEQHRDWQKRQSLWITLLLMTIAEGFIAATAFYTSHQTKRL
jgi:hypothetical protein